MRSKIPSVFVPIRKQIRFANARCCYTKHKYLLTTHNEGMEMTAIPWLRDDTEGIPFSKTMITVLVLLCDVFKEIATGEPVSVG